MLLINNSLCVTIFFPTIFAQWRSVNPDFRIFWFFENIRYKYHTKLRYIRTMRAQVEKLVNLVIQYNPQNYLNQSFIIIVNIKDFDYVGTIVTLLTTIIY